MLPRLKHIKRTDGSGLEQFRAAINPVDDEIALYSKPSRFRLFLTKEERSVIKGRVSLINQRFEGLQQDLKLATDTQRAYIAEICQQFLAREAFAGRTEVVTGMVKQRNSLAQTLRKTFSEELNEIQRAIREAEADPDQELASKRIEQLKAELMGVLELHDHILTSLNDLISAFLEKPHVHL